MELIYGDSKDNCDRLQGKPDFGRHLANLTCIKIVFFIVNEITSNKENITIIVTI